MDSGDGVAFGLEGEGASSGPDHDGRSPVPAIHGVAPVAHIAGVFGVLRCQLGRRGRSGELGCVHVGIERDCAAVCRRDLDGGLDEVAELETVGVGVGFVVPVPASAPPRRGVIVTLPGLVDLGVGQTEVAAGELGCAGDDGGAGGVIAFEVGPVQSSFGVLVVEQEHEPIGWLEREEVSSPAGFRRMREVLLEQSRRSGREVKARDAPTSWCGR